MMPGRILVCEPQCRGFEHAPFNAALLQTLHAAWPEACLAFLSEAEHGQWVRQALEQTGGSSLARTVWEEIQVPPESLRPWERNWDRFRFEWPTCRRMAWEARRRETSLVILSSLTNSGLLGLKLALYRWPSRAPVWVVWHGILRTALEPAPPLWRERLIHLRTVLLLPHPRRLRYIVLGQPILETIRQYLPRVARHFQYIDLPYLWRWHEVTPVPRNVLRFGFFGVGAKGFDLFAQLAAKVRQDTPNARFMLVGFLSNEQARGMTANHPVEGLSDTPLPQAEYDRRALELTYAVATSYREDYRVTASASFLDSLSYVKPIIALRNPYLAYYFERMGDIGYLCETPEAMEAVIRSVARHFPADRYVQQCRNILSGRRLFEPETIAPVLRRMAEEKW